VSSPAAKALAFTTAVLWCAAASCQTARSHAVKPGDTLWNIARERLQSPVRWIELQKRNGIAVPEQLQPGQVLQLASRQPRLKISVVELNGSAWITPAQGEQTALQVGTQVREGDLIVTAPDSFLCLALSDGSRMVLPSSSAIRLVESASRGIRFELLLGRVESYITKQGARGFEVRTRTAGVGVRGTHFRVRDESGISTAEVLEGLVRVENAGTRQGADRLSLPGGQGSVLGSAFLKAEELLPAAASVGSDAEHRTVTAEPVPGGVSYRLQLARDERLLQLLYEARSDMPTFQLPELPRGFYHSRVTAIDAAGLEGVPADVPIYVRQTPEIRPRASVRADRSVLLAWPSATGREYVAEVALDSDFRNVIAASTMAGGHAVVGPFPGAGLYQWRVGSQGSVIASGSFRVPDQ